MIFKNYYKILGLTKNMKSTQEEIKSAYREQAKKYHPDVNVNNSAAEERFKDINEAYRILSDPIQKKKYDKSWYSYIGKKIQKDKLSKKEVRANDIMNMFFGGTLSRKITNETPVKGENIETQIDITLKEAFDGTKKDLSFRSISSNKNKTITIHIPKGVKQGQVIRIKGQGKPSNNGGDNGDLVITVNIKDTPVYKLKNNDIYVNLYVTPWDAALGAKLSVTGIDGEVSILIPRGTQSGNKIAIPDKGYYKDEKKRGNLIIETKVVVPKKISEEERILFTKLKKISKFNPNNIVDIK